ncbi:hypothetical protein M1D88_12885 [Arthrobacter sp. R1-13]
MVVLILAGSGFLVEMVFTGDQPGPPGVYSGAADGGYTGVDAKMGW